MIAHLPSRLMKAIGLTTPITLIEMSRHLTGWPVFTHSDYTAWLFVMWAFTTAVVFYCGWPLLEKGWRSYRSRRLNMFALIAPGILITYGYSVAALAMPNAMAHLLDHHGHVPVYFEAAAMITTLVLLGQYIEGRAERRTGDALATLGRLYPPRACVIRNGVENWIATDDVHVGDILQLRAGDRIPVDGKVVYGQASVDESMLTGEPLPKLKTTDMAVTGGTLMYEGAIQIIAEKVGRDTVLAHIIQMVQEAQQSQAPIQRIADRVTGKLVPAVLIIALMTFFIWWRWGPSPSLWLATVHAVTVLMVTCPCALGLATPMSIMVGLGKGALHGILFKDAARLELLSTVDTLVLDKTGTLTTGRPKLHACIPSLPGQETTLLKWVASVEHYSRHPLALAIVAGAKDWGVIPAPAEHFRSEVGGGVAARVDGHDIVAGNMKWLTLQGIVPVETLAHIAQHYENAGCSVVWAAVDGTMAGLLVISDELKPGAVEAILALKQRGLRLVMITGDHEGAAHYIARQLGISDMLSAAKPADKANHIKERQHAGNVVAMAGDGINDAPALAVADVGIALGTGASVAMASSHVNLLRGDLAGLVAAVDLSKAVMRNIRQNLFFAFVYNLGMIPLAAGVFYPSTGILLTPMLASIAMSASSITVIMNALRLHRHRLE